jgi:hypothetical protein
VEPSESEPTARILELNLRPAVCYDISGMSEGKPFTVVRLSSLADLERACELAGIGSAEVDLIQTIKEKVEAKNSMATFASSISMENKLLSLSVSMVSEG